MTSTTRATKVNFSSHLDNTPALILALHGHVDLMNQYPHQNVLILSNDQKVLWTEHKGVATSCIVWSISDQASEKWFWIWLSYTAPLYRRHGLHNTLWKELVKRARKEGIKAIEGGINPDNAPMIAAAKRNGREISGILYRKNL